MKMPRFFSFATISTLVLLTTSLWNLWESASNILLPSLYSRKVVEENAVPLNENGPSSPGVGSLFFPPSTSSSEAGDDDQQDSFRITTAHLRDENNSRFRNSHGGLYLHVRAWGEGISAWRVSLAALMVLAKDINATIVTPSVKNGKLKETGKLSLFRLLDEAQLRSYHDKWITFDDLHALKQQQNATVIPWCIANFRTDQKHNCPRGFSFEEAINSSDLQHALTEARTHPEEMVVLELPEVRRIYFVDLRLQRQPEKIREIEQVYRQFQFSNFVKRLADEALASMGISKGQEYGMVHWRAEVREGILDYEKCADYIVATKHILQQQMSKDAPFVLMSSLSLDEDKIWSNALWKTNTTSSSKVLHRLIDDHDFRMSDTSMQEQKDVIIYAAVDLILAQRAKLFSTCTRSCSATAYDACMECNHLGQFADMAMELSWDHNPSAGYGCWPVSEEHTEPIRELYNDPSYKVNVYTPSKGRRQGEDIPGFESRNGTHVFDLSVLDEKLM